MFTITIDGPSASGKSTVADIVAEKLDIHHLNTGEFYRAITYYMLEKKVAFDDTNKVKQELKNINIIVKYIDGKQHNYLNNEDITDYLHSNEINQYVSKFATNEIVIEKASELTYIATLTQELVLDGRNVGSYVLPNAECKIYLDCDPKIRAERRMLEQRQKGADVSFEEIYKQTLERDELDRTRKVAPLVIPKDAYILDSSHKTQEEIAEEIVSLIKRIKKK